MFASRVNMATNGRFIKELELNLMSDWKGILTYFSLYFPSLKKISGDSFSVGNLWWELHSLSDRFLSLESLPEIPNNLFRLYNTCAFSYRNSIKYLELHDSTLGLDERQDIVEYIGGFPVLKYLKISSNKWSSIEVHIDPLLDCYQSLKRLEISNDAIATVWTDINMVEPHLYLKELIITPSFDYEFIEYIKIKFPCLKHLEMSIESICDPIPSLLEFLENLFNYLPRLDYYKINLYIPSHVLLHLLSFNPNLNIQMFDKARNTEYKNVTVMTKKELSMSFYLSNKTPDLPLWKILCKKTFKLKLIDQRSYGKAYNGLKNIFRHCKDYIT